MINVANINLVSGLNLPNAVLVINALQQTKNSGHSEELTSDNLVISIPSTTNMVTFHVAVFANQDAVENGAPSVSLLYRQDQTRSVQIFMFDFNDEAYQGMTPRAAAYAYLLTQDDFLNASLITENIKSGYELI